MGEFPRCSDGRRVFSAEFKLETVGRISSGEKTMAELSRELEVQAAVLRNGMRLVERWGKTAVAAGEDVVSASRVRELGQQVKQLQRLVGKQAMTIEILEAAREIVKKTPAGSKGQVGDGAPGRGGLPGASYGPGDRLSAAAASCGKVLPESRGP
jgi:transposase